MCAEGEVEEAALQTTITLNCFVGKMRNKARQHYLLWASKKRKKKLVWFACLVHRIMRA